MRGSDSSQTESKDPSKTEAHVSVKDSPSNGKRAEYQQESSKTPETPPPVEERSSPIDPRSKALAVSPPTRLKRHKLRTQQSLVSQVPEDRLDLPAVAEPHRDTHNDDKPSSSSYNKSGPGTQTSDIQTEATCVQVGDQGFVTTAAFPSCPSPESPSLYSSRKVPIDKLTKSLSQSSLWVRKTLDEVSPYRGQLMERLRRIKSEYITSDEARRRRNKRCNQIKHFIKVFLAHLFSTAGLCGLTAGYAFAGAFIFRYCEQKSSENAQQEMAIYRKKVADYFWEFNVNYSVWREEQWKADFGREVIELENRLKSAIEKGYREHSKAHWSLPESLLYSITVITTIGYGNVAPVTIPGKVLTIVYAVIGIPIMLLCLTNLGYVMAQTFKFLYNKLFCCRKRRRRRQQMVQTQVIELEENVRRSKSDIEDGISPEHLSDNCINKCDANTSSPQQQQPSPKSPKLPAQSMVVLETSEDTETNDRVPIWLVILIVGSYMLLGGWMFSTIEEWEIFDGIYFCFISLSTIGFGDLVPNATVKTLSAETQDTEGQLKLIGVCVYLICGLALIAMSFNLVQEEIILKCRRLARELGITTHS